jgi:LuxR family maltose regulon positive regulatory protein
LSLAKAIVILESSQLEGTEIESLLRSAEKGILEAPPFPGQEDVLGWIYMVQSDAATLLGDYTWMVEADQQVPKWIPKDFVTSVEALAQFGYSAYFAGNLHETETYWQQALDLSVSHNNTYYIVAMLNCVARTVYQKGELQRAEKLFQQALRMLAENPGQFPRWLGAMQRDYSDLLRDCNRLEEARALITTAIPLLEKWHTISALGFGFFSAARTQQALGDLPGAHEWLDKVGDLHRRFTLYPDLETLAQITRARIYLEEGKTDQAWQMLETYQNSIDHQYVFQREWVLVVQARILVHTGRPAEALALLAGWLESAKVNGRGRNWLSICLLTALAHHALGARQKAMRLLGDGLVFAQAHGHRRALIEEGEPLRALLEDFQIQFPGSPLRDYLAEILSLFPALPQRASETSIQVEGVDESLSPRELEILRLICQGLSNHEIADRLVLSVGTVKFHVHNIFGKLGVRDRPQAIAKASRLGLENRDLITSTK